MDNHPMLALLGIPKEPSLLQQVDLSDTPHTVCLPSECPPPLPHTHSREAVDFQSTEGFRLQYESH